jgi:hypothetical protein
MQAEKKFGIKSEREKASTKKTAAEKTAAEELCGVVVPERRRLR